MNSKGIGHVWVIFGYMKILLITSSYDKIKHYSISGYFPGYPLKSQISKYFPHKKSWSSSKICFSSSVSEFILIFLRGILFICAAESFKKSIKFLGQKKCTYLDVKNTLKFSRLISQSVFNKGGPRVYL